MMDDQNQRECEFLGWALLDLDDPIPRRAYFVARELGMQVEDFIEEAIQEKLTRMGAPEDSPTWV